MAVYPLVPAPQSTGAPQYIDPRLTFATDAGYLVQRARASRPRRRYSMAYLGLRTDELRTITDFLLVNRFGLTPFSWIHPSATDAVILSDLTPVVVSFGAAHSYLTGFWLWIVDTIPPTPALEAQPFRVTWMNPLQVYLNGTTGWGGGVNRTGRVKAYLQYAHAILPEDTWPEPTKLIGPEEGIVGRFSFSVSVEELF